MQTSFSLYGSGTCAYLVLLQKDCLSSTPEERSQLLMLSLFSLLDDEPNCYIHVLILSLGELLVLVMLHLGHGFDLDTAGCHCIPGILRTGNGAR
jgi:hypothetical protein